MRQCRGVFDGGQVTRVAPFAHGLDGTAQELAGACLGQRADKPNTGRPRHSAELFVHHFHDGAFELERVSRRFDLAHVFEDHKGHGHLAFERIGHAHDGHFSHVGMTRDALFDLARAQTVACDIDHIIGATQNEKVPVLVANTPVEGAVHAAARHRLPIGFDEACVVLPHRLHAPWWQGAFNDDHAFLIRASEFSAGVLVEQLHIEPVNGLARRAELAQGRLDAIADGQNGPARFGLPVVVDDGFAQRLGYPLCCGLVQWLTRQKKCAQRTQIVACERLWVLLLQHPHRRGRTEHHRDFVLLDKAPPNGRVGPRRQALVQDGRHARDERAVNDVAVAHHPANVAGTEIGFTRVAAKNVLHARGQGHSVAAGIALHPLGLAGGAAGIERVTWMCSVKPLTWHLGTLVGGMPSGKVFVAAGFATEWGQTTVDHQHFGGLVLRQPNGFVQQGFVGHDLATTAARVGADDEHRRGVVNAVSQAAAGKTTEHHGVDGANARARQHGKGGLGNHGHVDQDAVPLAHAQRQQGGSKGLHFGVQFTKGIRAFLVSFGRNKDQCVLLGTLRQVAINRVVAQVGLATHKPIGKGWVVVFTDGVKGLVPIDQRSLLGPKSLGLINGSAIKIVVDHANSCAARWG